MPGTINIICIGVVVVLVPIYQRRDLALNRRAPIERTKTLGARLECIFLVRNGQQNKLF